MLTRRTNACRRLQDNMIRKLLQFSAFPILLLGLLSLPRLAGISAGRVEKPFPTFTDVTKQAGLAFKIVCGDEVTEFLIDVNCEGACFFDYDNDGYQDIYLVNGSSRKSQKEGHLPHDYLLRNNGDGTFTDVTAKAHLGDTEWSSGCAVGDYDNDGYTDLYVTNYGPNKLYRNNGDGTFTEVARAAGVADPHWDFPKWGMGAAFGDIDNDGYLDLYVTNFVKFYYQADRPAPNPDSPCKMKSIPIACEPEQNEGEQELLYYINDGKGHFTDASWASGTAVDGFGSPQGSMGATVGDVNHDGLQDIFVTNFIDQQNTLYVNEGNNLFSDRTNNFNLGLIGFHYSGWGTKLVDFDNDGWLDLFITNGHTMEQLEKYFPADPFAEPNYALQNIDGKKFVDVSAISGLRNVPNKVGRGTAFGDFDNDGNVGVLVINKNDIPTLWRNNGVKGRNWITIRTEGVRSNRSGMGARILSNSDGIQQTFEVRGSDSYLSSNDLRAHIGLGDSKTTDLEIRWPSGQLDQYTHVTVNRFYLAREGDSLKPDPLVRAARKSK